MQTAYKHEGCEGNKIPGEDFTETKGKRRIIYQ